MHLAHVDLDVVRDRRDQLVLPCVRVRVRAGVRLRVRVGVRVRVRVRMRIG